MAPSQLRSNEGVVAGDWLSAPFWTEGVFDAFDPSNVPTGPHGAFDLQEGRGHDPMPPPP